MADIGVVHLARAGNGIEPFRRFLASYQECPGGIAHDLLIVYKGFGAQADVDAHNSLLSGYTYQSLQIGDEGFDINAYYAAARHFRQPYLCFLNSYSILLDADWLAKLYACLQQPGVGIVGATGSCESRYTYMRDVVAQRNDPLPLKLLRRARVELRRLEYQPFPACHLRTNAFLMRRDTLLKVRPGRMQTKLDVLRFESGRRGLIPQIERMGLQARLTGRDGKCYSLAEGYTSRTFRSGDQDNLLVADNQTELYRCSVGEDRRALICHAWGAKAAQEAEV